MNIQPNFRIYEIAKKYGHKVSFTPPYHSEVQPIEKVWAMVKNPIAFDPDLEEASHTLETKIKKKLRNIKEKALISVWKKSVKQCKTYYNEIPDNKENIPQ
jgi:transposase